MPRQIALTQRGGPEGSQGLMPRQIALTQRGGPEGSQGLMDVVDVMRMSTTSSFTFYVLRFAPVYAQNSLIFNLNNFLIKYNCQNELRSEQIKPPRGR